MTDVVGLLAGYSRHNTGDWLLVKHGLEVLRARHPGAGIVVVVADPTRFTGLGDDVRVVAAPVQPGQVGRDARRYVADRATAGRAATVPALKAIRGCSVAYACGGGYLQARSLRELATISAVHVTQFEQAHASGVPIRMLPQSVGPFEGAAATAWGRRILRWFPEVVVREQVSAEYLRKWDSELSVRQLPDLVFWNDMVERPPRSTGTAARVGLIVRNWWFPGSADPVAREERYVRAFAQLADRLAADGHQPVMVVHADGPTSRGDDRIASARVEALATTPLERIDVVTTGDLGAVESAYADLDVVVSTRMHGALIAIGQGVPTVCVGYEWKARGILTNLGLGAFVTNIDDLDLTMATALAADPARWPSSSVRDAWGREHRRLRSALEPAVPTADLPVLDIASTSSQKSTP